MNIKTRLDFIQEELEEMKQDIVKEIEYLDKHSTSNKIGEYGLEFEIQLKDLLLLTMQTNKKLYDMSFILEDRLLKHHLQQRDKIETRKLIQEFERDASNRCK